VTVNGLAFAAANALIRVTYGVAALASPSRPLIGKVPLAPDTEALPEARLFVRGFAAHQVAVGLLGLVSLGREELRRPAMALAAATDFADIASALVEARDRSHLAPDLTGGIAFSAAGLASAIAGMRAA
jgi:hypothetical protein